MIVIEDTGVRALHNSVCIHIILNFEIFNFVKFFVCYIFCIITFILRARII